MIHLNSVISVADNSGAKKVKCIKVTGSTGKSVAGVGDTIVVSIREAEPRSKVSSGQVHSAVVVRTKSRTSRQDGSHISFDDNVCVLLTKSGEMLGTRVFGSVAREVKEKNFIKIASLASEVL
jgi:large subunit ribosomal protein L14